MSALAEPLTSAPTYPTTVNSLLEARADMLARIADLEAEGAELLRNVDRIEACIRSLDSRARLERPKKLFRVERTDPTALTDLGSGVLRAMRLAAEPVTVSQIVSTLMEQREIEPDNRVYREALRQKVGAYLRRQVLRSKNAVVRRVESTQNDLRPKWEIIPLEEMD